MDNDLAIWILLTEVVYMDRLKHLVNAAMTFPEDQLSPLDGLSGIPTVGLIGIPDDHLVFWDAHLVGCITPEMFVREKEDLFPSRP